MKKKLKRRKVRKPLTDEQAYAVGRKLLGTATEEDLKLIKNIGRYQTTRIIRRKHGRTNTNSKRRS